MKADEYREFASDDLGVKLDEFQEEYFNLRFQNATGQLENFSQIGRVKRDIARLRTILRERDLGLEIEVKTKPSTAAKKAAATKKTTVAKKAKTASTKTKSKAVSADKAAAKKPKRTKKEDNDG